LKKNGLLIIESDKSEEIFTNLDYEDVKYKEKIYGRTRISMIKLLED
jgi:16S rRNA (guanine966-N2)-methyltransferase